MATKSPNSIGLYDIAGNIFEWTNDWKGSYNGKTIKNPLGASRPNQNLEKIVKGGSFSYGFEYLRPSYRGAPFSTTVSSSNEHVGFRCVRGAIGAGKGQYLDSGDSLRIDYALDSIGLYDDPPGGEAQNDFAVKMHLFWKLHNDLDIIFIGDPTLYCGIDCGAIDNYQGLNMGINFCGISCMSAIIDNYLLVHAPKLKLVGVNVPFYFEIWLGSAENTIGQSKGYLYDKAHDFWKDGVPAGFDYAISKQPFPSLMDHMWDSLGLRLWDCQGWGDTVPDQAFARNWTVNDSGYKAQFSAIVEIIENLSLRHVHLLMINFPESPYYRNTSYFTRFGPGWETGRAVIAQLKALDDMYPYFHFYDAYLEGNHDYTNGEATSYDRLCPVGAAKLTGRVKRLIDSVLIE